jgi:hypothetical protein
MRQLGGMRRKAQLGRTIEKQTKSIQSQSQDATARVVEKPN